ncbi:MAG: YjbQ family protein [Myxococcales bacterium]|nr:YjbQ family protein [Myxococcales bacterium]
MELYASVIEVATQRERQLVDITQQARAEVARSGVHQGLCTLYAQGATAALMVQENGDQGSGDA